MILKVARLGHPVLRQVAEAVPPDQILTPATQQFIDDMIATMHEYDGAGLAAPQVHVSKQIVIMEVEPSPRRPNARRGNPARRPRSPRGRCLGIVLVFAARKAEGNQ